jgi:oligopeptide transport system substrate-binding protein
VTILFLPRHSFRRFCQHTCAVLLFLSILPGNVAAGADPVTARIAMLPVTSLDPVSIARNDAHTRDLIENLFLGLTRYDPVSRQIQPALAREWAVSSDGLTWTFTLRDDVKWVAYNVSTQQVEAVRSVVAGDFVYGIRRACDPQAPNPTTHSVFIIKGCRRVATASPQLVNDIFIARELGVQALSDTKLEIKLAIPAPYFVSLIALPEFRPVPREAIAKDPDWTKPEVLLSNGPWSLADWTRGQSMTLVRNSLFPDAPAGNVERVSVAFVTSPDTIAQQFVGGTIDFARLEPGVLGAVRQAKPDLVLIEPGHSVVVLGFSIERNIVQNENLRRAFSHAIDRDALVNQILPGAAIPASRFTPPGIIGGPTDLPDNGGFSVASAKAAMTAAGLANCRLQEKLDLVVEDQPQMVALAKVIIAQWQANLGCNPASFNIRTLPLNNVQAIAHAALNISDPREPPRQQIWLAAWSADYADANAWLGDAVHCQYGYLRSNLACGEPDTLVDEGALETDPAKRVATYLQAESLWFGTNGTFPVAPLYMTLNAVGQQATLKGATPNGLARFDLWTISR